MFMLLVRVFLRQSAEREQGDKFTNIFVSDCDKICELPVIIYLFAVFLCFNKIS